MCLWGGEYVWGMSCGCARMCGCLGNVYSLMLFIL